jgi:DNA invertase Pin-like site-specific DNA recombinase
MSCARKRGDAHARRYAIYARSAASDAGNASARGSSARAFLDRYCADAGPVLTYEDGPGNGAAVERPGLRALVRDAVGGRIDTLVVHDRSSLAPDADLPGLLAALDAADVEVVFATAVSTASSDPRSGRSGEG